MRKCSLLLLFTLTCLTSKAQIDTAFLDYNPYVPSLRVIKNKGDRDTLFLKSKFNPQESYIRFNFDYDQLDIDTIPYPSGNGKYSIRYTGLIYSTDSSLISNGKPRYRSILHRRFTILVNDGIIVYIQEYIDTPNGEHYNIYRNEFVRGMKLYSSFNDDYMLALRIQSEETESYYIDERDSLVRYAPTPSKDIILDDVTIRTDSVGNVFSFYHQNRSMELLSPDKENGVIYFTYHPNGFVRERYRIDEQENKMGRYTRYNQQESIIETGNYVIINNVELKEGVWNYYDDNGMPKLVELYKNGDLVNSQVIKIKKMEKQMSDKGRR